MLHFLTGNQLNTLPRLQHSMFRDRAEQFSIRHGWNVEIDSEGLERDEYDNHDTVYIIEEDKDGTHLGSLRFLPTTGRTMLKDYFENHFPDAALSRTDVWECTRFCLGRKADRRTAAKLLAAGGKLMVENELSGFVGIFDPLMERRYRMIGSSPIVLGRSIYDNQAIGAGLWMFDKTQYEALLAKSRTSIEEMELWFANSVFCSNHFFEAAGVQKQTVG